MSTEAQRAVRANPAIAALRPLNRATLNAVAALTGRTSDPHAPFDGGSIRLAAELGVSPSTAALRLRGLADTGAVIVQRRSSQGGRTTSVVRIVGFNDDRQFTESASSATSDTPTVASSEKRSPPYSERTRVTINQTNDKKTAPSESSPARGETDDIGARLTMIGRRRAVAIEWLAPAIGANPCDPDALFGIIRELTKLETVYGIAAVDAALRTALSPITAGTVARPWRYLDAACRNSPDGRGISMDVASAPAGIRARPGQRHSGAELLKTLTLRRLS